MSWQLRRATIDDLDGIMAIESREFANDAWSSDMMRAELGDNQTIAVAADARRQGIGRALMHALMVEARDRGASELFLEVRDDNPSAQRMYDSLGFERIAVRPNYYQPDGVDAIVMKLTIPEPKLSPAVGR